MPCRKPFILISVFLLSGCLTGCQSTAVPVGSTGGPDAVSSSSPVDPEALSNSNRQEETPRETNQEDHGIVLLPEYLLYPPYLASNRIPQFRFSRIRATDNNINVVGKDRWDLRAGQKAPLLKFAGFWQLSFFGGIKTMIDSDDNLFNIGWDGVVGASVAREMSRDTAVKIEFFHQSSHIGDDIAFRRSRGKIGYIRNEFNTGITHRPTPLLRAYAEAGYGLGLEDDEFQAPLRVQTGFEFGIPPVGRRSRFEWGTFVAGDFESMEELDWQVDTTIQAGIYAHRNKSLWRFGVEFRDGRVPYGEFSQTDETYIGFVLWASFSN